MSIFDKESRDQYEFSDNSDSAEDIMSNGKLLSIFGLLQMNKELSPTSVASLYAAANARQVLPLFPVINN